MMLLILSKGVLRKVPPLVGGWYKVLLDTPHTHLSLLTTIVEK